MMREILTTAALLLLLAATPVHSGFQEAWTKRKQLDHDYALDRAAPHYQHPRHRRHARLVTALDRFMAIQMHSPVCIYNSSYLVLL